MKKMLLSFKPEWFEKVRTGEKIYEHRSNFPEGDVEVYFYVSRPIQAIVGKAIIGERLELRKWLDEYEYDEKAVQRIKDSLTRNRYVMKIKEYQDTNMIPLEKLRSELTRFVVPQMYYYLEGTELDSYLIQNCKTNGRKIVNSFDKITSDLICKY